MTTLSKEFSFYISPPPAFFFERMEYFFSFGIMMSRAVKGSSFVMRKDMP